MAKTNKETKPKKVSVDGLSNYLTLAQGNDVIDTHTTEKEALTYAKDQVKDNEYGSEEDDFVGVYKLVQVVRARHIDIVIDVLNADQVKVSM